jgi:hypothetical protein
MLRVRVRRTVHTCSGRNCNISLMRRANTAIPPNKPRTEHRNNICYDVLLRGAVHTVLLQVWTGLTESPHLTEVLSLSLSLSLSTLPAFSGLSMFSYGSSAFDYRKTGLWSGTFPNNPSEYLRRNGKHQLTECNSGITRKRSVSEISKRKCT